MCPGVLQAGGCLYSLAHKGVAKHVACLSRIVIATERVELLHGRGLGTVSGSKRVMVSQMAAGSSEFHSGSCRSARFMGSACIVVLSAGSAVQKLRCGHAWDLF